MMKRLFGISLAALCVTAAVAGVKSGLQEGQKPPAYHVRDITGPSAGKSLCYRCQFGSTPVVNIFVRQIDENVVALIKKVDGEMAKNEKLNGFVTLMTGDDEEKAGEQLKTLAKAQGIKKLPLTVFAGEAGPKGYNIAKDANVTVLMWNQQNVKVNHAYEAGGMCEACVSNIVSDIPKILGN